MDEGDYALSFENDVEECLIRVMPKWDSTMIRIEVRPRGEDAAARQPAKSEAAPRPRDAAQPPPSPRK
jgi:hypothetical protein